MANKSRVSEGVAVGWDAYAFIIEFREALINKNPKNVGLIQGSLDSWINNLDLA